MQYTTHYNLNLPEGTDIVNPLVQDNPNYTAIDTAMFDNKQSVIGSATEIVSGTVHAITRLNTDSDYFRFTATGNWTTGDSMSVDGVNVSVFLSDGTTPATGAYIINTEVLVLLSGTRVTLITSASVIGAASDITYDNTGTGLTAANVQDAINEIDGIINRGSVKVIADGILTYSQLFDSLYALVDKNKLTGVSYLTWSDNFYSMAAKQSSYITFTRYGGAATLTNFLTIQLAHTNSFYMLQQATATGNVFTDNSAAVPTTGTTITVYY